MSTTPYISHHSGVDGNGQEYIDVVLEESNITETGREMGGKHLLFEMNHMKQISTCGLCHYDGGNRWDKTVKVWKSEILAEQECLQFAREFAQKAN